MTEAELQQSIAGKETWSKEPSRSWKRQGTDSALELQKECIPANTLVSAL